MDAQQQNVLFSSASSEWGTPTWLFEQIQRESGLVFDLDVCATKDNAKCAQYYTKAANCFVQPWYGNWWCNPVYGQPEQPCTKSCTKKRCPKRGYHVDSYQPGCIDFIERGLEQAKANESYGCFLVPARTDVVWWRLLWSAASAVWFLQGRIPFVKTYVISPAPAPFPSALVFVDPYHYPRGPTCKLWTPEGAVVSDE